MRITLDTLLKIAKDTVNQRARPLGLIGAYLHGSLLTDKPLLGGTADIDLFFIHIDDYPVEREIVRLSEDVHLDITHHNRSFYRQARELRRHPWMGPTMYSCKALYDPQHFIDFIQASVRGQYNHPENVLSRSRQLVEEARQIWFTFEETPYLSEADKLNNYLTALKYSANSIAIFSGSPLPIRRLLEYLSERAEAIEHGGFYPGLLGLMGASKVDLETITSWLPAWKTTYQSLPADTAPAALHPVRLSYYQKGIEALLASEKPLNALWPLLVTWTQAASLLPADHASVAPWKEAADKLGLTGDSLKERLVAFDQYLDSIEDTLESWANKNGVSYAAVE